MVTQNQPELDKLIFPHLCPNLDKQDDRIAAIASTFHKQIRDTKVQDIHHLEFETKLGHINLTQFDPISKHVFDREIWDILPNPRILGKNSLYFFKSKLHLPVG